MTASVWTSLLVSLALLLCAVSGARLPYSASIVAGENDARGLANASPEKGSFADHLANSTHHAIPVDPSLPFSCQQQGCGPDVACPGGAGGSRAFAPADSANCYLYQGMFLCCTISPLGSKR